MTGVHPEKEQGRKESVDLIQCHPNQNQAPGFKERTVAGEQNKNMQPR